MWAQGVRLIRWTDKKSNPEDSKFQVSFKYRFFNKKGTLAQKYPWVKGFRFGYTQTSFWDLKSESKRRLRFKIPALLSKKLIPKARVSNADVNGECPKTVAQFG